MPCLEVNVPARARPTALCPSSAWFLDTPSPGKATVRLPVQGDGQALARALGCMVGGSMGPGWDKGPSGDVFGGCDIVKFDVAEVFTILIRNPKQKDQLMI